MIDVVDDGRRRVQANLGLLEVGLHLLAILVDHHADFEIDDAFVAKGGSRLAGLGVERDQAIARRDVEHAIVAFAVGPIGHATARELTRRPPCGPLTLVHAVDPLLFAGARVERDDGAARASHRVNHPLDHQRRRAKLCFGTRTEIVGLESPRDFHLAEVAGVDLIEWGILTAAKIGRVQRPLAVLRARHRAALSGDERREPRDSCDEQRHRGDNSNCDALHFYSWHKPGGRRGDSDSVGHHNAGRDYADGHNPDYTIRVICP